jgi:hypothetical protein
MLWTNAMFQLSYRDDSRRLRLRYYPRGGLVRVYTYRQSTGVLDHNGIVLLAGYAGHGNGVNNPDLQDQHDIGPLPRGLYNMTALIDSPHTGLATIILDPDPANQMFGRSGFRIHGDNAAANHTASDGCIIAGHAPDRTNIWNLGDHHLEVVA